MSGGGGTNNNNNTTIPASEARNLLRETLADLQDRESQVIAGFKAAHDCQVLFSDARIPTERVHMALQEEPQPPQSSSKTPKPQFRSSSFCVDFVVTLFSGQLFIVEYDAVTVFLPRKLNNHWTDPAKETLKCEARTEWFRRHMIPVLRIGHCVDPDSYRQVIWDFIRLLQRYIDPPNSMFLIKTVGECYEGESETAPNSVLAQVHIARELSRLRRAGNIVDIFRQHPATIQGLEHRQHPYKPFDKHFDFMVTTVKGKKAMIDVISMDIPYDEFKEFFCQKYQIPLLLWQFEHGPVQPHLSRFVRAVTDSPDAFVWRR